MFLNLRRQYFSNPSLPPCHEILMPKITEYLLGTVCIYILHALLCFIHRKVKFFSSALKNQFSPCWANVSKHLLLLVAVLEIDSDFVYFLLSVLII